MDLSPDMQLWNGRVDTGEGDRARRWHQVVRPLDDGTLPGIALLGFACDEGVARNQGRIGAAEGPAVLRWRTPAMWPVPTVTWPPRSKGWPKPYSSW